jgi:hypothetical protein
VPLSSLGTDDRALPSNDGDGGAASAVSEPARGLPDVLLLALLLLGVGEFDAATMAAAASAAAAAAGV